MALLRVLFLGELGLGPAGWLGLVSQATPPIRKSIGNLVNM